VGWDQLDAQVACREFGYNSTSLGMFRHACLVATLDCMTSQSFFFQSEAQALNGSNLEPWYGPVYLENVMCNGTERFGFQCSTTDLGVITNPECYNPYRTAGVQCMIDINECELETFPCHSNANCTDTNGSFICTCMAGFEGNGFNCTDIPECDRGLEDECDVNATCINTFGSYDCICNTGFSGSGFSCTGERKLYFAT